MKARLFWRTFSAWLMVMLGFSSCDDKSLWDDEDGGMMLMYGSPRAEFDVTVKVTDEAGKPVKGIKLRVPWIMENQPVHLTGSNGEVNAKFSSYPNRLDLVLEDIDGEDNGGKFQNDTLNISDFKLVKTKEGKGWFMGEYKASAEVKMKKEN